MVDADTLVTFTLQALAIKNGVRLQFGPETSTAVQINALAVWEDVTAREVVMLAVEKLFEGMVREIQEYYDEKRNDRQG
jgi:hypothetical protein